MKYFVLALLPVFAFANTLSNTSRIACHKNSESFIELEFSQTSGVLLTRDLVGHKMIDAEYKVTLTESKDKLIVKSESPGDLVNLSFLKPQKINVFQFISVQKTLKNGTQKPAFYGCVYLSK